MTISRKLPSTNPETTRVAVLLGQPCSNGTPCGTFKLIPFNSARQRSFHRRPLHQTKSLADHRRHVQTYITTKRAQGQLPKMLEIEKGLPDGYRRRLIRNLFYQLIGRDVKPGRPPISPK
jgi:hypothetical protein